MAEINKEDLLAAVRAALEAEIVRIREANRDASEGATDSEARAESKWDTCGLELSYLARGHARQFEQLAAQLDALASVVPVSFEGRSIDLGALVEVDYGSECEWLFFLPGGGGIELEVAGCSFTVITPESPIGKALEGKGAGDEFSLRPGVVQRIRSVV